MPRHLSCRGGGGIDGERTGMWREMARIIGEVRSKYVFVENSPMLVTRGLERVLADLTSMGYDSKWGIVSAADVGAPHKRERIWILANTKLHGFSAPQDTGSTKETTRQQQTREDNSFNTTRTSGLSATAFNVAYTSNTGLQRCKQFQDNNGENISRETITHGTTSKRSNDGRTKSNWWDVEPNVGRVADGVAARVDRLKAIGNGQVPLCAATAWELLK